MATHRDYFGHARPEMMAFIPRRRRTVLDVGCGEGWFAKSIEGAEELWGVEPDPASAGVAEAHMHAVLLGTYDEMEPRLPDGYFDVVICNDVIEHMPDHEKFFLQIRKKIAPGGAIIGSVPNVRYFKNLFDTLVLRDWDYKEEGILDRTHFRFFTLKSLRRTLTASGFSVDVLQPINPNIRLRSSLRENIYSVFGLAAVALSLGHSRDVAYLQLAFRGGTAA